MSPSVLFQVPMGSMRHRRNGNFENSRLLYSSMSRSIDVACSDAVSTWYMLVSWEGPTAVVILVRSRVMHLSLSPLWGHFPNRWPWSSSWHGETLGVYCVPFEPCSSLLCFLHHSWFWTLFHVAARDKFVCIKNRTKLFSKLDGQGSQHIVMLNILSCLKDSQIPAIVWQVPCSWWVCRRP